MATNLTNLDAGNSVVPYELSLRANREWAMSEGSGFFAKSNQVHKTVERISARLNELNIPHAICGGMGIYYHGYERFTDDVDILVTRESKDKIHDELDGRGYVRPFEQSKNLRDTITGVRIEFLLTGQFPGDGKPKELAFPDPKDVNVQIDGVWVLNLPMQVSLKLLSGMTGAGRLKDLGDVIALIQSLGLPRNFKDKLTPSVQQKFDELWLDANAAQGRLIRVYNLDTQTETADPWATLDQLHPDKSNEFAAMRKDNITADMEVRDGKKTIVLSTNSGLLAKKYDMHSEREYDE
jgi:hypothetical protein